LGHDAVGVRHLRVISSVQPPTSAFAGFRFPPDVILIAVCWYLRYGLSYRDLEEFLAEAGASRISVVGSVVDADPRSQAGRVAGSGDRRASVAYS
jgi:hypothetical protein